MKIIIPMTGYGSRFIAAGYKELKPFIKVQGVPIIEWIVKGMYKGETDFLFICRKEHIDSISHMRQTLKEIAPSGTIFAIEDWVKKGPVWDVLRASQVIDDDTPCLINYCDFYMTWNYDQFRKDVMTRQCAGAIPCYTGFHPHLFHEKNLYASCRVDEEQNLVEIREKYSFEQDKTKTLHSPGVYYFESGKTLNKYAGQLVNSDDQINGEYYASLIYNYMVKDHKKVWVPANVEKFCQWGTPEDLGEYLYFTDLIRGVYQ
ncbi:MAG: capsular biosynthesis protein [Clostridia bacterium]|nr:capsular biosynthesis protein [Clostridia bacterium]